MYIQTETRSMSAHLAVLIIAVLAFSACMKDPEEKFEQFMASGRTYAEEGDHERAILQFKNAARALPENPEPFYQTALSFLALGNINEAASAAFQADRLDPQHVGAQILIAQLYLSTGRKDYAEQAQEKLNGVLSVVPSNSEAQYLLAATKFRLGSTDEARELLEGTIESSPDHLKASLALARLKMSEKDLPGAERVLADLVKENPSDPGPRVMLGGFYLMLNREAPASAEFRAAEELDPQHAGAMLGTAAILMRQGKTEEAEQVYQKVSNLPDKRYRTIYGQILAQHEKFDEAIAEYMRLREANPSDRSIRNHLVSVYLAAGKVGEAETVLTKVFEENPEDVDALLQRARIYHGAGKQSLAQRDLEKVIQTQPDSVEARYLLARVYGARNRGELQRKELEEALRLNEAYLPARIELTRALLKESEGQTALNVLQEAPAGQEKMLAFVEAKNWALLAIGQGDEAQRSVDEALASMETPGLLLQSSILKLAKGDVNGGRKILRNVLDQNPRDTRALDALIKSFWAKGEKSEAIQAARTYAGKAQDSAETHILLGTWYERAGEVEKAKEAFRAAAAAAGEPGEAEFHLARLEAAAGNSEAALRQLTEIIEFDESTLGPRLLRAVINESNGKVTDAVQDYQGVLELNPDHFVALNNLSYRLSFDQSKLDQALKHAQRAKEIAPDNADIDDTLGWVYYQKGIYESALQYLEAAQGRIQNNNLAKYHLGMTKIRLGQAAEGRALVEEALRAEPDAPEAELARTLLAAN